MAAIILSFGLEGEVSLPAYAQALKLLQMLINALCLHRDPEAVASWDIAALRGGSAQTTLRGASLDQAFLDEVSHDFVEVGRSMERGETPAYPFDIAHPAARLTHLLSGRIIAMSLGTPDSTAVIATRVPLPSRPNRTLSYGIIAGTVETLQRRKHKFTLYEEVFDDAVACYLQNDQEEMMRHYWGKDVRVTGDIERDVLTQRPREVTRIEMIELLPRVPSGGYERTRGILDFRGQDPMALLRNARDAE